MPTLKFFLHEIVSNKLLHLILLANLNMQNTCSGLEVPLYINMYLSLPLDVYVLEQPSCFVCESAPRCQETESEAGRSRIAQIKIYWGTN